MLFEKSLIDQRKSRAAKALDQIIAHDDVVLVHAGHPIQRPGGFDQTYNYLPHPDYFWLTSFRRVGGISAYSKSEGWVDFVSPVTRDEKIWEGGGIDLPGKDLATFDQWLSSKKFKKTFHLGQHAESVSRDPSLGSLDLLEAYNEARRYKDQGEVELVKKLAGIANEGYKKLKTYIRPGVSERDIQIAYETEVQRAGSERLPYDTIVGAGTNSAVLHAIPTSRIVKENDIVLIDAGADIQDYCVDVTRVYSATGTLDQRQKTIFDIVLRAQTSSINLCKPGIEWSEVHLASAREIAKGLKDLGIMKCSVDEALESSAVSVFFPHGVGHMVGLRVRDVGGKYNPNPKKYAGARLRVDIPLKENYIMTVEPGLYFISALLNDEETKATYKNQINFAEAEKWSDFGGVRLEDDILVKSTGYENLTSVIEK